MKSLLSNSGVRYFAASLAALALDYVLTLALFHAGLTLSLAAAISFCIIGCLFYFVHEHWTFRAEASGFSGRRLAGTLIVAVAAGLVRVAVIFVLESWRPPAGLWVSLYFMAGVVCSFSTNFCLNRFLVFRR